MNYLRGSALCVEEAMTNITQTELKRILGYNPITGIFTWKVANGSGTYPGDIAGYTNSNGYVTIKIKDVACYAHRLAILYVDGYCPENFIDHIDQTPHHNWYTNLREASQQCNMRNKKRNKNNKSGVTGVSWVNRDSVWWASLKIRGVIKNLGYYKCKENAICARFAGEQCVDWELCNCMTDAHKYIKECIQ